MTNGKIVAIGAAVTIGLGTITYLAIRAKAAPGRRSPCPPVGDIDGNGYITQNDLALLLYDVVARYPNITDEELLRADVNGDGVVNALDISTLELFLGGEIDTFPACGLPPGS